MTKGKPRTKLSRYERAEYDMAVKRRRWAFVYAEMMRDPSSRFHGMSYAYRPGCPCKCEICEESRRRHLAEHRERVRAGRAKG